MTLGTDDGETSGLLDLGSELDVRTTARHVGGDCHHALLACVGHDFGLLLMELGVEDIVGDMAHGKHAAQELGDFDGSGADKHGASLRHEVLDFVDNGGIFLLFGLIDAVVHIDARYRLVGRDGHHIELIDVPELTCFRFGRTGHAGKLMVHAEVVLEGDCGEGLGSGLDFHVLLGLDGLVETVTVAATFHDTACLLVDNLDFAFVNHIFHIFLEEGVGFQ